MNDEQKPRSWWTTLPGILTTVTATITALTGLITALGHLYASIPVLQRASASAAESIQRTDSNYYTLDISAIANTPIDNIVGPGFWQVRTGFKTIPFSIPLPRRVGIFQSQNIGYQDRPIKASLPVAIQKNVRFVYVLLTGTYVEDAFRGRQVGSIHLRFSNGSGVALPIIAFQHLRENWSARQNVPHMDQSSVELLRWDNVFRDPQTRGSVDAEGYVDMITLSVPPPFSSHRLLSIEFLDESVDLVNSLNPGLAVYAVTLE